MSCCPQEVAFILEQKALLQVSVFLSEGQFTFLDKSAAFSHFYYLSLDTSREQMQQVGVKRMGPGSDQGCPVIEQGEQQSEIGT